MKSLPFLKNGNIDFCSPVSSRLQNPHIFHVYNFIFQPILKPACLNLCFYVSCVLHLKYLFCPPGVPLMHGWKANQFHLQSLSISSRGSLPYLSSLIQYL